MSDEDIEAAVARMAGDIQCPRCRATGFDVEWKFEAKPLGTFSLSGSQLKFSATKYPVLTCRGCGLSAAGNQGA